MFYKCQPKSYIMTLRRRRLCRPLARGSRCAFARKCLSDRIIRKFIVKGLGRSLQREIAQICSDNAVSILRDKATDALKTFTWRSWWKKLECWRPRYSTFCKAARRQEDQEGIKMPLLECWWPLCADTTGQRFDGLLPAAKDWHAKMCFLEVRT